MSNPLPNPGALASAKNKGAGPWKANRATGVSTAAIHTERCFGRRKGKSQTQSSNSRFDRCPLRFQCLGQVPFRPLHVFFGGQVGIEDKPDGAAFLVDRGEIADQLARFVLTGSFSLPAPNSNDADAAVALLHGLDRFFLTLRYQHELVLVGQGGAQAGREVGAVRFFPGAFVLDRLPVYGTGFVWFQRRVAVPLAIKGGEGNT